MKKYTLYLAKQMHRKSKTEVVILMTIPALHEENSRQKIVDIPTILIDKTQTTENKLWEKVHQSRSQSFRAV